MIYFKWKEAPFHGHSSNIIQFTLIIHLHLLFSPSIEPSLMIIFFMWRYYSWYFFILYYLALFIFKKLLQSRLDSYINSHSWVS